MNQTERKSPTSRTCNSKTTTARHKKEVHTTTIRWVMVNWYYASLPYLISFPKDKTAKSLENKGFSR